MHYYKFHIGDYRSSTAHLSNEEDLAYRRLLDFYYDTELPIPLDTQWVSRRIRVANEVVINVLKDFFIQTDDGWIQETCIKNIHEYHHKAETNRANGKSGGRPKKPSGLPVATQSEPSGNLNHKPLTTNHKPNIKKEPLTLVPDWLSLETWNAFVEMRKKIKKPMTDYAMKLLLGKLTKMKEAGVDVDLALQNSILHGWQDVYEPKKVEHPVAGKQLVNGRDPTLIQLEADFKKATPMPANIREMMKGAVKTI